jgi:hypothetical protein
MLSETLAIISLAEAAARAFRLRKEPMNLCAWNSVCCVRCGVTVVVYYESIKRELQIKPIYECRCDENWIYYESIKRELKRRLICEYRCNERLKTKTEESTSLSDTGLVVEVQHLKTKMSQRSFVTIHINLTKIKHMQPQGKEKEKGNIKSRQGRPSRLRLCFLHPDLSLTEWVTLPARVSAHAPQL